MAPALEAASARRVVEIGALRGEQTTLIVERLGADGELHVIDPLPDFDPAEHEARFPGRYVFHRALSLDVLGDLPPMDAALIDGDHNWYTVVNELRLLRRVARDAGAPLPLLVLHDVGWPYGRRDLYYDPDTIPAEHRQDWRRAGIRPGVRRLVDKGGLNPTMDNAVVEGGPRNGVLTALEDFLGEHDRPVRMVLLPFYFGLAIVAEEERLARQPALVGLLDHLESADGRRELLELSEAMRIEAMLFQHRVYFEDRARRDALAARYLATTALALTNQHLLENEARLAHLAECLERGKPVELPRLRDPERHDADALRRRALARQHGGVDDGAPGPPAAYAYATNRDALDHLVRALDEVRATHTRGDLATCAVGRGGAGILLRAYLEAHGLDTPTVWVADRFRAAPEGHEAPEAEDGLADLRPDLNTVRDAFARFDLLDERVRFLHGDPTVTLADDPPGPLALLHVGPGASHDLVTIVEQLYPRLAVGGHVVIEDLDPPHAAELAAVRDRLGSDEVAVPVGARGVAWRRVRPSSGPRQGAADPSVPARGEAPAHVPLAPPAPAGACDLSVVVVVHDMAREAPRMLRSLSRTYQEGVDDLDYEVVVVENGGPPDGRLGEPLVRSFGPEFRYLDLGDRATPSPAPALNRGIAASRGRAVALMVDGAHVLTPGVLREAMVGLRAYEPAVVAVQPWHVGPGQQGEAIGSGYGPEVEDDLFAGVGWPADGYRLFEISHFQGDRDWLDGLWESNCLFAPRSLLEQVGGFDEGFSSPGGGYTNLDLYERLGAAPGVTLVSVLGEGSFHQVHGGTTTNQRDPRERRRRVVDYARRFAALRGRPFTGPEKTVHYVGGFRVEGAKRTRARRMTAGAFPVDERLEGDGGPARRPVPIPDDLRDAFVAAYHRSLAWRTTRWLGHDVPNAPTDLLAYQELVAEVRPDWIVETGTRAGGRAFFLATVCDLLDHGQVLSVDSRESEDRPDHPRVTYLTGRAHDDDVVGRVKSIVGPEARVLVVLGTRGARRRMHREFEVYSELVPEGSYVVVEHTVLNGYPVEASFGPGPFEALRRILNSRRDFAPDTARERHGLTFNRGGFLRRVH